jgi:Domain of unknown function (DUF4129)
VRARRLAERGAALAAVALPAPARPDLPAPSHDPGQVRQVVREVLARPEFRPPPRPLLSRLLDWLLELVGRLLAVLGGSTAGGVVGLLLLALALVAVGVVVARFSRGITPSPELAAALPAAPARPAVAWRAEAEGHERAGEWRAAVRCRYRALLAELAARGLVEEAPGRTAGEYRGQVGRNLPAASADFAGATELFELAWYGRRPAVADQAARLRDLSRRVLEGSGEPRRGAPVDQGQGSGEPRRGAPVDQEMSG